jgi:hypothetical protein
MTVITKSTDLASIGNVGETETLLPSNKQLSNESKAETNNDVRSVSPKRDSINPEDVIAWLMTQPNANETLYLENVVRQYMYSLRSAPLKLEIPLKVEDRNVFDCHTVEELSTLWEIFKSATNYRQVNKITSGMFSAGMGCLLRFVGRLHNVTIPKKIKFEEILSQDIVTKLTDVLSSHFVNGFMLSSSIELFRFRRFFAEDFNEEIVLSDESLNENILSCGILFDGKIFVINPDTAARIKNEVDSAITGGAEVIFYDAFYGENENWLLPANVISENLLKVILTKMYPRYVHEANYFASEVRSGNEIVKIERELLRIWGDDVLLSYEQLSKRLPYIPIDKIKNALAQNGNFIWNAEGIYSYIGKVYIDDEERTAILDYVATANRENGYASFSNVPLGEIAERNYKLSLTAVHSAIFAIVLSDKYDHQGKIITCKGGTLDALTIMKEHCRSLDRCSLRDLLDFERKLTGETHRWIPMKAGYAVMVRISADTYVAEKYVHFETKEIDSTLDRFVTGEYISLKRITAFTAFPHCGQAWNLFLLESYCRRFSDKFLFAALSVNSVNAGVIVRKESSLIFGYKNVNHAYEKNILLDVIAKSDVVLGRNDVIDFLFENGYIGRRSYAKVDKLIELAKPIRKREN